MTPDPAQPVATNLLRRDVDRDVVQSWLDALSTGACDEEGFLRAVEKLTRRSLEAGWDALSLLDQYYRLGKIPADTFNSIKSRLGSQLVGAGTAATAGTDGSLASHGEVSVPLPQAQRGGGAGTATPVAPAPAARAATRAAQKVSPPKPVSPASLATTGRAAAPESAPVPQPARAPEALAPAPPVPLASQASTALTAEPSAPAVSVLAARTVEPLRRARREIAVGEVLRGRYAIKSVLGRGGTGMVFEAADLYRIDMPDAGQRVALKVLHGQISSRADLLAELQREFQLLQSLSHPNIVRVHDFDRDGDIAFFTMEHLRGLSLTGVLAARNQAPMERANALSVVRDVGAAMARAHSRAVVHGDLNPGNIFITNEGDVRVLDFGAAHASSGGPTLSGSQADPSPIATPRYASAQVLEGKRPDARDDVYSLACIAYLLLTGKHPFGEKTALEAQERRLKPPRPADINGKEWRALRRGLAFDRERRPSDVVEWLSNFDWSEAAPRLPLLISLVRVAPRKRGRVAGPVFGAAAVLAALAAAWWGISNFNLERFIQSEPSAAEPGAAPASPQSDTSGPTPPMHAAEAPANRQPQTALPAPPPAPPQNEAPAADTERAASGRSTPPADASPAATVSEAAPASRAPSRSPSTAESRAAPVSPSRASEAAQAGIQPRSRIELAADSIEVPLTDPAARVLVRRRGSLHGPATFTWWTESGTAKPGQDFMAVAPHQEVIEDGKNAVSLFIPVVNDSTRQQPKSFYVVINDPGAGVSLGARTLTMVTIPPSQ